MMKNIKSSAINDSIRTISNPAMDSYEEKLRRACPVPRTLSESIERLATGSDMQKEWHIAYMIYKKNPLIMTKEEYLTLINTAAHWLFYCDLEFKIQDPELYQELLEIDKLYPAQEFGLELAQLKSEPSK